MDHIDKTLATATENNYPLAIKAALIIGKKKPSIGITTKLTTLKFSGLQWVSNSCCFNDYIFLIYFSITSSSQARIFQERRMA
jgi:hypothetical protein